jgi:hypothetical protein
MKNNDNLNNDRLNQTAGFLCKYGKLLGLGPSLTSLSLIVITRGGLYSPPSMSTLLASFSRIYLIECLE